MTPCVWEVQCRVLVFPVWHSADHVGLAKRHADILGNKGMDRTGGRANGRQANTLVAKADRTIRVSLPHVQCTAFRQKGQAPAHLHLGQPIAVAAHHVVADHASRAQAQAIACRAAQVQIRIVCEDDGVAQQ